MRASVHRLQVRIDGVKELPTRRLKSLCEEHQGRQGRDALASFDRADEAPRERTAQIRLRHAQGDASAPDLEPESPPGPLIEVRFRNT